MAFSQLAHNTAIVKYFLDLGRTVASHARHDDSPWNQGTMAPLILGLPVPEAVGDVTATVGDSLDVVMRPLPLKRPTADYKSSHLFTDVGSVGTGWGPDEDEV